MIAARRLSIHGRVQGVFYRDWAVKNARALGVAGWVRNCADGRVEAHLEGEEQIVRQMIERMRKGPIAARVERIDESDAEPEGLDGFERR